MIKTGAHHTSANRMKWKALIRQTHEEDPKEEDRKRHRKLTTSGAGSEDGCEGQQASAEPDAW